MDENGRPPLDPYLYENLDSHLHEIDKLYWKGLRNLQVEKTLAFFMGTSGPPPPKLPLKLRNTLDSYATSLFAAEANAYPGDDLRLEHWLKGLAERTEQRVNGAVAALEEFAFLRSLEHHGLTESQRCEIVHDSVQLSIEGRLGKAATEESSTEAQGDNPHNWSPLRWNFEAFRNMKELRAAPPEQIPETLVRRTLADQYGIKPEEVTEEQIRFEISGLLSTYPAITVIPSNLTVEDFAADPKPKSDESEIERRSKLLAEYISTTGSSNKRIYEARNSGIHKPEFYEWRRGSLPSGSSTTIAFERFLREKKPTIPRKSRPQ